MPRNSYSQAAHRSKRQRHVHHLVRALEILTVLVVIGGVGAIAWVATGRGAPGRNSSRHPVAASSSRLVHDVGRPMHVVAATPSGGTNVNPLAPVVVRFSQPLGRHPIFPTLSPAVPGNWSKVGTDSVKFTPSQAYAPLTKVTLTVTSGAGGTASADGAHLARATTDSWEVKNGSPLRMQQILAQLGYLPLTWTPASSSANVTSGMNALYDPPAGTFSWKYPNTPPLLQAQWQPGTFDRMTMGAMVAFERSDGMVAYTSVRSVVWPALLQADAQGTENPAGYTYAMVSKTLPETLTLWHDGADVLTTPVNTGVPQAETPDGTFFVYSRLAFQYMKGTNPDGSHYDVPVHWINYFDGSDAIHGYPRAAYGFPQSNGCVELPVATADIVFHQWINYGTLVTISS